MPPTRPRPHPRTARVSATPTAPVTRRRLRARVSCAAPIRPHAHANRRHCLIAGRRHPHPPPSLSLLIERPGEDRRLMFAPFADEPVKMFPVLSFVIFFDFARTLVQRSP